MQKYLQLLLLKNFTSLSHQDLKRYFQNFVSEPKAAEITYHVFTQLKRSRIRTNLRYLLSIAFYIIFMQFSSETPFQGQRFWLISGVLLSFFIWQLYQFYFYSKSEFEEEFRPQKDDLPN